MENTSDLLQNDLVIDAASAGNVKESAMWAKFLGITGFIYSGLVSVMAVFMGWFFQKMVPQTIVATEATAIGGIFIGLVYFVMAIVLFFLSLYLFKFGTKAQTAIKSNDQESLAESLKNLKYYFRFIGVVTLISLIVTALGVVGMIMAAASSF